MRENIGCALPFGCDCMTGLDVCSYFSYLIVNSYISYCPAAVIQLYTVV